MFEGMPTLTIRFEYLDNLEIEFRPAVLDLNPLYVAATIAWVQPLLLASKLPDDHPASLSEERATRALARVYGMSVLVGSKTSEELDQFTPDQWTAWLLDHPDEFVSIRSLAEFRPNFVDEEPAEPPSMSAQLGL